MSDLVERAREFACAAHRKIDHRRKYSGEPYEVHLKYVAELVATVTDDERMIAAAWLHDTVEDTAVTLEDIQSEFGDDVAELVENLTDVSRPHDGNRAERKAEDRKHSAKARPDAKTVKLADIISNVPDIASQDSSFGRVYVREAAALLGVLKEGDPRLYRQAWDTVKKWDRILRDRSYRHEHDAHPDVS